MKKRTKVFISYSHRDAEWLARLRVHFKPLERNCDIDIWDDTSIKPSSNWKQEIADALTDTKVAVLLVSADFLASDFILNNELPRLLSAAERNGTVILPVIISASYFLKMTTLSKYQAVNDPSNPLINMSKGQQEEIFVKVAEAIEASYTSIRLKSQEQPANSEIKDAIKNFSKIQRILQKNNESNDQEHSVVQKKVCMLGAFAVGKTSLVQQFVKSIFSEKYMTTVGMKIDQKFITIGNHNVRIILWDLAGEDEFQQVRTSYLRGSSGYILVADGTRSATLAKTLDIHKRAVNEIGHVPFILIINKADLMTEWEITDSDTMALIRQGWTVIETSAKTGAGVEETFLTLAEKMISG